MAVWTTGERITAARLNNQEVTTLTVTTTLNMPITSVINGTSAQDRALYFRTGGLNRIVVDGANSIAETGANAGSNYAIYRYDDAGGLLGGGPVFGITRSTGLVSIGSSAWNGGHFEMGAYRLWVDSSGRLRIKSGAPSSDTDGTIVGTQS
jgi:hypothetical protein